MLWSDVTHLYGAAQVDACLDGHVVRGLEEGPLQEQGEEEQHGQHVRILQELFGGNEIDPQQTHLDGEEIEVSTCLSLLVRQKPRQGQSHGLNSAGQFL